MPSEAALFHLEPPKTAPSEAESELYDSCKALFDDLEHAKMLGPIERAKRPLLLTAARTLGRSLAEGTITVAAANAFKQYVEALDNLPRPGSSGEDPIDALEMALMAATGKALSEVYPQ